MSVGLPEAPGARLCGREQAPIEMTKAREIPGFFLCAEQNRSAFPSERPCGLGCEQF
jgi:hypothetical protein